MQAEAQINVPSSLEAQIKELESEINAYLVISSSLALQLGAIDHRITALRANIIKLKKEANDANV